MSIYAIIKTVTLPHGIEKTVVDVLFALRLLMTAGTLLLPIFTATRGRAIWNWATNWLAGGAIAFVMTEYYPSWEEPAWHAGLVWALVAWAFLIAGFVIAVRKPRKRDVPAE